MESISSRQYPMRTTVATASGVVGYSNTDTHTRAYLNGYTGQNIDSNPGPRPGTNSHASYLNAYGSAHRTTYSNTQRNGHGAPANCYTDRHSYPNRYTHRHGNGAPANSYTHIIHDHGAPANRYNCRHPSCGFNTDTYPNSRY